VTHRDPDEAARDLAAESADATGWFERLYVAAEHGEATVPWDRGVPNPLLVEWAETRKLAGDGRRALVVGCGLGKDSEYVAGLGFQTVAFDISETAIRTVHRRFPASSVQYVVADLLDPPDEWTGSFDLVVESITVQSLPPSLHADAIAQVVAMVAPGGTLIVHSGAREDHEEPDGPPWPLTRAEIDSFAGGNLQPLQIEELRGPDGIHRWRAEFRRG
jgi:SAM-dependent methyltransferase